MAYQGPGLEVLCCSNIPPPPVNKQGQQLIQEGIQLSSTQLNEHYTPTLTSVLEQLISRPEAGGPAGSPVHQLARSAQRRRRHPATRLVQLLLLPPASLLAGLLSVPLLLAMRVRVWCQKRSMQ